MKKIFLAVTLLSTALHAQFWIKIDSVFSPFGVTVQSFSAPDFCDIDNDGDFDLFVGTLGDDRVAFFKNTGTSTVAVFRRDTSLLQSIYAQGYQFTNADYPALADLDSDNDFDLVIGGFNGILFYKNVGDSLHAQWLQDTVLFDAINDTIGTDAKPAFGDLDNDGDLDLLIGIGESFFGEIIPAGVTIAYRNNGTPSAPSFVIDNSLVAGIPDVGLNSYPYLKEMDNDGDLDLMLGRDLQTMLYYRNTGTAQAPTWTSTPSLVSPLETTTYWKNPAVCDLDGDNDNDLIYGTSDGSMYFYQNTGTPASPVLLRNTSYFQMIRIDGGASTTSFADFDKDGDLDLLSGDWLGGLQYFRNDGNSAHPDFKKTTASFTIIDVGSYSSPRFVDLDNDGDFDIVAGNLNGTILCYINNSGTFAQNTTIFSGIDVGWQSAPSFADINNDGSLDMLVCGEVSAEAKFYKNNGSNVFAADNSFISGVTVPSYAYPCFADIDKDGDYDLTFGKIGGELVFYENTGTSTSPAWQLNNDIVSGIEVPQNSSPAFADLDGDGKLDLIIGEYSGNFSFYKNLLPTSVQQNVEVTPSQFVLEQNFPNPFNPSTTIRFSLPKSGLVSLKVFDLLGKEIAELMSSEISAGTHSVRWNASHVPSGMYFYTLRTDKFTGTKKLLLLK
ncbi:MAG: T9SS type A sorting domain-containing protein [Ignavibacteriales bacterium]|nr:T9SS type A sorting domain-containing protein [Ignavibacteriales bacterium]